MSKDAEQKVRKTSTMKLQGGVEYAKVATRLVEFHEDNAGCSIETDIQFQAGGENTWIIVTATVVCPRGRFVAHSMDAFKGKQKFLEKLETVAVGRALAYAGYMASGEIASFEELDNYEASRLRNESNDVLRSQLIAELKQVNDQLHIESLFRRIERMTTVDEDLKAELTELVTQRKRELKTST